MLHLNGQLPDVMGATFEATIQQLTEQAKPTKGQPWDSFEHRAADALAAVCAPHQRLLIPHGHWVLDGNPNHPDGLHLLELADLTPEQRRHLGLPPP
jgi:hypothetical protein